MKENVLFVVFLPLSLIFYAVHPNVGHSARCWAFCVGTIICVLNLLSVVWLMQYCFKCLLFSLVLINVIFPEQHSILLQHAKYIYWYFVICCVLIVVQVTWMVLSWWRWMRWISEATVFNIYVTFWCRSVCVRFYVTAWLVCCISKEIVRYKLVGLFVKSVNCV